MRALKHVVCGVALLASVAGGGIALAAGAADGIPASHGAHATHSTHAAHAAKPAAQRGSTFGEHGMALFGGQDGLYASHLPMFHAPHNYQVVLKVHLADAALDAALRRRLDGKPALWTVAPEKFELDRLAPGAPSPLTQFRADLVLGHFEQGGKVQHRGAAVVVDKVLVYRQLVSEMKASAVARYVQVGNGQQRFLIKEIDSRPDFDHIVSYTAAARATTLPVTIARQGMAEPDAATLASALQAAPSAIRGTVYFYTDDLR